MRETKRERCALFAAWPASSTLVSPDRDDRRDVVAPVRLAFLTFKQASIALEILPLAACS